MVDRVCEHLAKALQEGEVTLEPGDVERRVRSGAARHLDQPGAGLPQYILHLVQPPGRRELASIQGLTSHQRQVRELDLRQVAEDAQDGAVHTILLLIELLGGQLAHTREQAAVGPRVEAVQLSQVVHRSQTYTFCRGGVNLALSTAGYLRVTALVTERQHAWIQGLIGALAGLRCTPSHVIRLALDDLRDRHWSPKTLESALRKQVWRERETQRPRPDDHSVPLEGVAAPSYRTTRVFLTEPQYVWTQAVVGALVGLRCTPSHVMRLALNDLRDRHSSARSLEAALRRQVWRELDAPATPVSTTLPPRSEPGPARTDPGARQRPRKESDSVRVLLVDDHPMVRAGLRASLAETADLVVVGELPGGEAAVSFVERERPDVVLMNVSKRGVGGLASIRAIAEQHPDVKVVAFPTFTDRELVLAAVEAGAVSFLFKDAAPSELVTSIRAAARGESPVALRAALALLAGRAEGPRGSSLTNREREVLALVGRGLANKQIARRLGISEKTVKTHLGNTFQRIGVGDRTQAALWAERNGLLEGS